MRLEDLQSVLSNEELMAFGLFPVPTPPPAHHMLSPELAGGFIESPTVEFGPAA